MYATMRMRSKRREKENKKNAQRSTKKREGDPRYIAPSLRCHSALGVQTNPRVKPWVKPWVKPSRSKPYPVCLNRQPSFVRLTNRWPLSN